MKMCNRCGRELSEDNFSKDKSKKDGLRTIVKIVLIKDKNNIEKKIKIK